MSIYDRVFLNLDWTTEEVSAYGETTVTRLQVHRTHLRELLGMTPTGKQTTCPAKLEEIALGWLYLKKGKVHAKQREAGGTVREKLFSLRRSEFTTQESRRQSMYYRVAIQGDPSTPWQWKSTMLSSLDTLFKFLRLYQALPQDRLRVFSSSSREEMNRQLARENQGLPSTSVTAAQFLQERMIGFQEGRWRASGSGTRGIERKVSNPVALAQSLNESNWGAPVLVESGRSVLEKRRLELERGAGGDNDAPYRFTLSTSLPQVLAWMKLLAKVHRGELQP